MEQTLKNDFTKLFSKILPEFQNFFAD